jgi:ATP-dependent DNA ligase
LSRIAPRKGITTDSSDSSSSWIGSKTQPYNKRIAHKDIWVEPELMVEIEYRAKTAAGKVRHPFFKGLREDVVMNR